MGVPQYPVSTFRASAKPSPNGIPRTLGEVVEALVRVLVALITTPANIVTWLLFRPPVPLKLFLLSRIVKYSRSLTPYLLARESKYDAGHKPARPTIPFGDIEKTVSTTNVTIPPAKRQPAAPGQVQPTEAYGFILTPNGSKGKGADKAQTGEKIIIYFHGGWVMLEIRHEMADRSQRVRHGPPPLDAVRAPAGAGRPRARVR